MIALLRLFAALVLLGSLDAPSFRASGSLGDSMGNVVDRVEPGHVLLLQEIYGVAFALREHGDEDVGAGYLLAARRLDVDCGALQYALEARRRLGIVAVGRNKVGELVIDIVQNLATQPLELATASAQHGDSVLILRQRKQQMLKRGIFVPALVGTRERPMERFFEIARQHADPPFTSRKAPTRGRANL